MPNILLLAVGQAPDWTTKRNASQTLSRVCRASLVPELVEERGVSRKEMREPERTQVALDDNRRKERPVLVDDEGRRHSTGRRVESPHNPRAKRHDAKDRLQIEAPGPAGPRLPPCAR